MTRHTPYVTIKGYTKSVTGWLQEVGMSYETYVLRIKKGMTQVEAITTPQTPEEIAEGVMEWRRMTEKKKPGNHRKVVRKFIRNGGGAGTWRDVEVWTDEE